jgi:hypothetical protein
MRSVEFGTAVNRTDTGYVMQRKGALLGFYVNSTNAGTLVLKNGGSSGTAVSGTITPAIGFHRFPAYFDKDCHATIGGTALNVTFAFDPD